MFLMNNSYQTFTNNLYQTGLDILDSRHHYETNDKRYTCDFLKLNIKT